MIHALVWICRENSAILQKEIHFERLPQFLMNCEIMHSAVGWQDNLLQLMNKKLALRACMAWRCTFPTIKKEIATSVMHFVKMDALSLYVFPMVMHRIYHMSWNTWTCHLLPRKLYFNDAIAQPWTHTYMGNLFNSHKLLPADYQVKMLCHGVCHTYCHLLCGATIQKTKTDIKKWACWGVLQCALF